MPKGINGVWLSPKCPICGKNIPIWAAKENEKSALYDTFEVDQKCYCQLSDVQKDDIITEVVTAVDKMDEDRKSRAREMR